MSSQTENPEFIFPWEMFCSLNLLQIQTQTLAKMVTPYQTGFFPFLSTLLQGEDTSPWHKASPRRSGDQMCLWWVSTFCTGLAQPYCCRHVCCLCCFYQKRCAFSLCLLWPLTRSHNRISAAAAASPAHLDSLTVSIQAANANLSERDLLQRKLPPARRNRNTGSTWKKSSLNTLRAPCACPPFFWVFIERVKTQPLLRTWAGCGI